MTDELAATPEETQVISEESAPLESETTSPVEASTEATTEAGAEIKPVESDKASKKINKLYFEARQAERERDEYKAKFEAASNIAPQAEPTKAPSIEDFREEDFDYDDTKRLAALNAANTTYQINEALKNQSVEAVKQAEKVRQEGEQKEINSTYDKAEAEYIEANADYVESVQNLPKFPLKTFNLIMKQGPKMAHYLSKNPEIALQIANSSSDNASFLLGHVSSRLDNPKPTTEISNAPVPSGSLGSGGGSLAKSYDQMSQAEIMAL